MPLPDPAQDAASEESRTSRPPPDARSLRWGWILWFAWLVVGGELLLRDLRGGGPGAISVVLVAPLWLVWTLWLVWRLVAKIGPSPGRRWHGSYFEFDGVQMRVLFDADSVWVVAADVFDAFGLHGHARDAERVRRIAGRDGLVARAGAGAGELLCFTERGLRVWLERRTDPQAAKFVRWFDTQVIAPYRKRREIDAAAASRDP